MQWTICYWSDNIKGLEINIAIMPLDVLAIPIVYMETVGNR